MNCVLCVCPTDWRQLWSCRLEVYLSSYQGPRRISIHQPLFKWCLCHSHLLSVYQVTASQKVSHRSSSLRIRALCPSQLNPFTFHYHNSVSCICRQRISVCVTSFTSFRSIYLSKHFFLTKSQKPYEFYCDCTLNGLNSVWEWIHCRCVGGVQCHTVIWVCITRSLCSEYNCNTWSSPEGLYSHILQRFAL